MRKNFFIPSAILFCFLIAACGGGKTSAKSVAQKWCELNAKVNKAPDGGPEYGKAKAAREKYEEEMESKYKNDEAFMAEVKKEAEKCEDASEEVVDEFTSSRVHVFFQRITEFSDPEIRFDLKELVNP